MIAIVAIAAAVAFLALSCWRFVPGAPRAIGTGQLVLAIVAGAAGALHWSATGDSRWLIGGLLLLGGGAAGWSAAGGRRVTMIALVAAVLGTALFGIAHGNPRSAPSHQSGVAQPAPDA